MTSDINLRLDWFPLLIGGDVCFHFTKIYTTQIIWSYVQYGLYEILKKYYVILYYYKYYSKLTKLKMKNDWLSILRIDLKKG